MFFDNTEEIEKIAEKVGCSVFVVPNNTKINIKNAIEVRPGEAEKTGIVIEQIRDVINHVGVKQGAATYIIIYQAEQMNSSAANAFLKNLEEPKENYHYILQTETPHNLLPTILSRAKIYIKKQCNPLDSPIEVKDEIKTLAKSIITAKPKDLVIIAEEIAKKKDRNFALEVLKTAIEICFKSYFKTEKNIFIQKMPGIIKAYENIEINGNIKLHLVADMI